MADYIYYNGELYHAQKKQHKYVARVKTANGKYRYFYTREEYNAYRNAKESSEPKKTSKLKTKLKSVSKFFKDISNSISKLFNKSKKELGKTIEKGRKFVNDVILGKKKPRSPITTVKEKMHKYIARVKMSNGKYKYFYDTEAYKRYLKRMEYQKDEPDFMKKVPKINEDDDYTEAEDMAEINEAYSPYEKERSHNCVYCSIAYELRCRGYDVQAAENKGWLSYKGSNFAMSDFYENPKMITLDETGKEHKSILNATKLHKDFNYDARTVNSAILEHSGKNTRGEIRVSWKSGSAHSMVYEVLDNGGVIIRDSQVNQVYNMSDLVGLVNQITITRTDNLKLKKDILKTVEDN